MRRNPVRSHRRREQPLMPREFHDSRVVLMDAAGNVISKIPAAEFAERGRAAAGPRVDGRSTRWSMPTITPQVVATWDAAKRGAVRARLKRRGQPIPDCLATKQGPESLDLSTLTPEMAATFTRHQRIYYRARLRREGRPVPAFLERLKCGPASKRTLTTT